MDYLYNLNLNESEILKMIDANNHIKDMILKKELKDHEKLQPIRKLSEFIGVNNTTVVKAYELLENEGYIQTVHGKGSYIKSINHDILSENIKLEFQQTLEQAISKANSEGLSIEEIKELFMLVLED